MIDLERQQEIIYKNTLDYLKNKMENDKDFQQEIETLLSFYTSKLMNVTKTADDRSIINKGFDEVLFSQYFQGYYTMSLLLLDEENEVFQGEDWTKPEGLVRNEIPKFLKLITIEENIDWTHTEIGHNFSMDILESMENGYDLIKQICSDITHYGAFKAFVENEKYKGDENIPSTDMLLGTPFDLNFISPQLFTQAQFFTEQHEVWDIFFWSAIREGAWVGSIHLSTMPIEEKKIYLLEFSISSVISRDEKSKFINDVIQMIPEEILALLQIRLYHVDELDILVSSKENPAE